jgi:hypothetical protein
VTASRDPFFEARGRARRRIWRSEAAKIEAEAARLGA